MRFVQLAQEVFRSRFFLGTDRFGPLKISNRQMISKHHCLMSRWKKPVTPVGFAIGRLTAQVGYGNISRKIVVLTPQRIARPGTRTGEPFLHMTGIHQHATGTMRVGFGSHGVQKCNIVHVPRHVGEQCRYVFARISTRRERPGRSHQIPVFSLE